MRSNNVKLTFQQQVSSSSITEYTNRKLACPSCQRVMILTQTELDQKMHLCPYCGDSSYQDATKTVVQRKVVCPSCHKEMVRNNEEMRNGTYWCPYCQNSNAETSPSITRCPKCGSTSVTSQKVQLRKNAPALLRGVFLLVTSHPILSLLNFGYAAINAITSQELECANCSHSWDPTHNNNSLAPQKNPAQSDFAQKNKQMPMGDAPSKLSTPLSLNSGSITPPPLPDSTLNFTSPVTAVTSNAQNVLKHRIGADSSQKKKHMLENGVLWVFTLVCLCFLAIMVVLFTLPSSKQNDSQEAVTDFNKTDFNDAFTSKNTSARFSAENHTSITTQTGTRDREEEPVSQAKDLFRPPASVVKSQNVSDTALPHNGLVGTNLITPVSVPISAQSDNTFKVVGVPPGDFLNMRSGPGVDFPVILAVQDGVDGIVEVGNQVVNGSTRWLNVNIQGTSGWVSAAFLQPKNAVHPPTFDPD